MKVRSHSRLLVALMLLGCFAQVQAQGTNRSVTPVPQRPAPTPPSLFPAGAPTLPNTGQSPATPGTTATTTPATPGTTATTTPSSPVTTAAPTTTQPFTPPLDGTVLMPGTAIGGVTTGNATYPANSAATMGAGGGPNPSQTVPSGAGPYTALQLSQSFQRADANRDGELTRAEFQRLTIAPASFEEMDRDRNGIVTRSEYDDGSR